MFRDGVVLVDPAGVSVLPHEEIVPARVESLMREWIASGVQETPITVLVDDARLPARLIVADGHHRCEAARRMAAARARRVAVAARFFSLADQTALIMPTHRVIHRAPEGWASACQARLRARLSRVENGSLAFCSQGSVVERYDGGGLDAVAQLRLLETVAELDTCEWTIESDEAQALDELAAGRAEAVILVPALTVEDVLGAAMSGRLLPPRSTNFQPKPVESSIRFPLNEAG